MRKSVPDHAYLPPELAAWMERRVENLGLRTSTYIGILVRNAVVARQPVPPAPAPEAGKRVREEVHFSLEPSLHDSAGGLAYTNGLTLSGLVAALIAQDRRGGESGLMILSMRGAQNGPSVLR